MVATPASPQGAAPRGPAGGLFGATRAEVGARDRLTFTFQTAEGFDSELPAALRSQVPQGFQAADGWSTLFRGSSDYARRGRTLEIAGTASSAIRYYHEIDRLDTLSHAAGLGFAIKLPKQGNFRVDSTAAYSPSYLYQLFPVGTPPSLGASIPTNPDYRIDENRSYSYRTSAALSFGSRLGTMVTTSGEFNRTEFEQQSATARTSSSMTPARRLLMHWDAAAVFPPGITTAPVNLGLVDSRKSTASPSAANTRRPFRARGARPFA